MGTALWNLLCFAVAIGILVAVHEYGHFLAARRLGVRVLKFSLGFGPVLLRHRGCDGCEYALSLIPLGGFVKMLGENPQEQDAALRSEERSASFAAQKPWRRAVIIAAGPAFNLVLAFILYFIINLTGVQVLRPVVGDVTPGSIADRSGLMVYDRIESLGGNATFDWQEVMLGLAAHAGDRDVALGVRPDLGAGEMKILNLDLSGFDLDPKRSPLEILGLKRCIGRMDNTVQAVVPDSPAQKAGLRAGDRILTVGTADTPTFFRLQDEIRRGGAALPLTVERAGVRYETVVYPEFRPQGERQVPMIGIEARVEPIDGLQVERIYGWGEGAVKAVSDTVSMATLVARTLYKLVSGAISAENISGPIAIARGAGDTAAIGLIYFISFLAAISVNLGVLNLIPIPVLDGGQLLFIAYEQLTGRTPGARVQMALMAVGFALLGALMAFAVFNDLRAL